MKIRLLLSALAWLSTVCCAPGQDAKPAPSPPPIALSYPFTDGMAMFSIPAYVESAATPFYAYGGEPLWLPVTARAPLGTHLRIFADVTQQAGSIAVPWQRNTPVGEEIVFDDRTSIGVSCELPALRVVQRKTRVSVTLHTEPKMANYPGGLVVNGFVYPREEPDAWQKQFAALLARAGIRRVAVFGRWKNTGGFLRNRKVAFDDLGDDWPSKPDAHTLYLGSGVSKAAENAPLSVPTVFNEVPGVRLVLFEPWDMEVLPPGVYQTVSATGGGVWKVTLPDLFVGGGVNEPHALEILTTLFEQVLPSRQPATGDNPEPTPNP